MQNFIDEEKIINLLEKHKTSDKKFITDILAKCQDINHQGLSLEETAALLQNTDPETEQRIFKTAKEIKKRIYGNRIVLFAPLYVSNACVNNCTYCGFRIDNKKLVRKTLNKEEINKETKTLTEMGHKRLLMVYGEFDYDMGWVADTIQEAYGVKSEPSGEIRRINVNMAPLSMENFKAIKTANIGTYQCFQETYSTKTYKEVHPSGPKADFSWRLYAMHRAMEAGIDDVGMGVLYGLSNYKFDTLGLLMHCQQLEKDMGVGPHTISFPRIEEAMGSEMSYNPPHKISDNELRRIIAISRLAVPYTGMILSTRESAELRKELLEYGISQISAASRVYPGSYNAAKVNQNDTQQFTVHDPRSLDDVIYDMVTTLNYIPSFCTGCYRKGRTGDHFMGLAKTNFMSSFCTPNGILTFAEYLRDYASPKTKEAGKKLIDKLMKDGRNKLFEDSLCKVQTGESDVYL
ncbi:MAG: [FeFe] hydrogenase H-cluster radical SAM maturase HydG [Lactobacillaceae bacterium]|jgi:2-iminoacetate synthase|nr:[FeFe] hydrogenase H-cluster radical SAM maturase HydG [Lactobacillaceae bacterium]